MPYSIKDIKQQIKKFGKHQFVRAELLKRGYSYKRIARELGVSVAAVRYIVEGKHTSKRIASRIEEILELPKGTLFEYTKED